MKDSLVAPFVAGLFIFMLLGAFIGAEVEESRLYKKCLVEQQDKPHKDAVALCTERVK
jgi:hypothetical protein